MVSFGKQDIGESKDSVFFNHRQSRRLVKLFCCLDFLQGSKLVTLLNKAYIVFVYILLVAVIAEGLIVGYSAQNTALKVEAIHYTLVIVIILAYITNELFYYSDLERAWVLLRYTYENYNGEVISEEQKEVHRNNGRMVQNWNNVFSGLMVEACIAYLSFAPVREAILSEPDAPRSLPIPLYIPFEASQNPGYSAAVIWEGITLLYLSGVATSAHQSYLGYMGALRAELKLLNYSILKLEERAAKKLGISDVTFDTYKDPKFQKSLYSCLREDIIHHQLLLKYYNLVKGYLGIVLLVYIVVASIILAAAGYLITRPNSPMDESIKFVVIVCSELWYIFCLCWFSEKVSEESGETFRILFGGTWYMCNKQFNDALNIMLCGTLFPIRLKTNVFGVKASLETYNSGLVSDLKEASLSDII